MEEESEVQPEEEIKDLQIAETKGKLFHVQVYKIPLVDALSYSITGPWEYGTNILDGARAALEWFSAFN